MYRMNPFWAFIGRLGISFVFILGGISQAISFTLATLSMKKILCFWHDSVATLWLKSFFLFLDHISFLLVAVAVILELVGGILLLFGIKVRFAALLLLVFLVPATIIVHQFWLVGTPNSSLEFMRFFLNIALMGTMVFIISIRKDHPAS